MPADHPTPLAPDDDPTAASAERTPRRLRRWLVLAVVGAVVVLWLVLGAWIGISARSDLTAARADLRDLRDDLDATQLLDDSTTPALDSIADRLRTARDKVRSPVVAPARFLPVVGRQIRAIDALSGAALEATEISSRTLRRLDDTLSEAESPETDRVAMIEGLRTIAADAKASLAALDLGPADALVGPVHDARREFATDLADLIDTLDDVETTTTGLGRVLEGPGCYLLFAANNAEMRAGSGMFLQAGELCFDGGHLDLNELDPTGPLRVPQGTVAIDDVDLRDRWGFLLPNSDYRNLALSPRFPANAALAADMWRASTGHVVDGVLAVDPVALEVLLETTGPVEVDGVVYRADNVVDELLVEQYKGFLDDDYDPEARKDRLGIVASAAVSEFDDGGWNIDTLLDRLPEAAEGRHILAWARDPEVQTAWETMGVAGDLRRDSIAVSVLNRGGGRGGGKLDPKIDVTATLTIDDDGGTDDGIQQGTIEVEIANTSKEGRPTYAENPFDDDVRFGMYEGILSVNLPGASDRGRIDGIDPLLAVGADGPTRVVAARFEIGPEQSRTFTVRFDLPSTVRSVQIEPSARIPAIRWRFGDHKFKDRSKRTISW